MSYKQADGALRALLTDAIVELCRRQSFYVNELRIEATLCIVSDCSTVAIVQISEKLGDRSEASTYNRSLKLENVDQSELRQEWNNSNAANESAEEYDEIEKVDRALDHNASDVKQDSLERNHVEMSNHRASGNSVQSTNHPINNRRQFPPTNRNRRATQLWPTLQPKGFNALRFENNQPCADLSYLDPNWSPRRLKFTPHRPIEAFPVAYDMDGVIVDGAGVQRSPDGKFVCPYCNKSYGFKHTLKDHINKHLGRRPHICKHCALAFTHLANLCAHVKRCHDALLSTAYRCAVCAEKCASSQALKQHRRRRHRDVIMAVPRGGEITETLVAAAGTSSFYEELGAASALNAGDYGANLGTQERSGHKVDCSGGVGCSQGRAVENLNESY